MNERFDAVKYKLTRPPEEQGKSFKLKDYLIFHEAVVQIAGLVAVTVALTLFDRISPYRPQAPKVRVR